MRNTWKHSLSLRLLRFINKTTDVVDSVCLKYQKLNIDTWNRQSQRFKMSKGKGYPVCLIYFSGFKKRTSLVCYKWNKHTKLTCALGTGALDTINTVPMHQLMSTSLGKMQLMVHRDMALKMAALATPDIGMSWLCCVAKKLFTFIATKHTFYG